MELCSSNIEKILIFREMKPCTFRPQLKIFSLKKLSEKILLCSQIKAFLIFREMELCSFQP